MTRALCGVLLLVSSLNAHDLWLIPPEKAAPGAPAIILMNQGMEFPKSTNAINPKSVDQKWVIDPNRTKIEAETREPDGNSGRLAFTPTRNGLHVVAVATKPKPITLEADDFNAYLVSDGMPHIFLLRHREGTLNKPAREQYRKSVKAIVPVGAESAGEFDRPLGLPLEIVPLMNPLTRKPGETLPVRVYFQDKPLTDANLGWSYPGDGDSPRGTVRTNPQGEARIPIDRAGLMTIRLTHMTRPKARDFEWESFWSTLTFRVSP